MIAEAQKAGGAAAFIDVEHAFDPSWAKRLGVNLEGLMVNQPSCGEEALEVCELLVRSNALDLIAIDSVAALVPRAELEGQMGDTHVGLQARLMSQALRKLTGISSKSRTSVIFINQIREKIGVMYGSPETTPGGRALKFYSSLRIDVRRIGMLKDGDQVIGNRVRAKVVKNKVAPPFRQTEFDILFESGISGEGDLLDLASECGIVSRSGTWFSYGATRLGQGRENARQFLRDNPDMLGEIRTKVLEVKRPKPPAESSDAETEAEPVAAATDSAAARQSSKSTRTNGRRTTASGSRKR
jgi:recombination protein RecA